MSLEFTYDGAPLAADIAPSTIQLPQRAENGEPSFGAVPVENGAALTGHRPVIVEEDDCAQPRLFTGYVTQRDFGRSAENALIVQDDRLTDITIVDQNAIFGFRVIWDTDGNRPEETWDERLAWILGSDYMSGLFGGDTTFIDSHPNPMDAADYRGSTPGAVFDDLMQRFDGSMNYFAFWNPDTTDVEIAVFGIDDVTGACTLSISNDPTEINSSTVFAPDMVAKLAREPDQVYSSVIVEYANGKVYRTLPATATTYIERGTTISRPYTGKASTAQAQGDQFLLSHSVERDRITCVMQSVPAASVGLVRAGMSIDVHFTHLPDYAADFVTMRIVECSPVPVTDIGTLYDISLELVGGVPAPPETELHQAVIICGSGSKTQSFTGAGTKTINFGGNSGGPPFDLPPVVQDTDGYSGTAGELQWGGPDITTLTIPAGLDGTYRLGMEQISVWNDWWVSEPPALAATNPQEIVYIPEHKTASCGHGVTTNPTTVTYAVCVNGTPVASGSWISTRTDLEAQNPRGVVLPVEVELFEGDEITGTVTVDPWGWTVYHTLGNTFGCSVPAEFAGALFITLVGSLSGAGPVIPPIATTPDTTTSPENPTADDDEAHGYKIGDHWINTGTNTVWVLVDASTGGAIWVPTTGGDVNVSEAADPTSSDDGEAGYAFGSVWINADSDEAFVLVDPTDGAAVWRSTTDVDPAVLTTMGAVGELLISDTPSTPLVFADILQNEAEADLLYADLTD